MQYQNVDLMKECRAIAARVLELKPLTRKIALLASVLLCSACSPQETKKPYTSRFNIDAGTQYVALEMPSTIGGECSGWNTVSIRKPGRPETGLNDLLCWKREGDDITLTDRSGANRKSGPASLWSD